MREEYSLKRILKTYSGKFFISDLFAGLTVAIMMVPQGMAYAMLAGLPPIYGLYAGFVPLFIFPFFSSSKHLSIGPVALVSILLLAGLSPLAEPFSNSFISLAILVGLIAGIMQILFAALKLGALVSFLSRPVILGFTAGAAIIICVSQLKSILGLSIPRASHLVIDLQYTFSNLDQANFMTMVIGIGCIVLLLICRKISKYIPAALIAVIVSSVWVYYKDLWSKGVAIVGDIPSGLPAFVVPDFNLQNMVSLLSVSFLVAIISIISSMAISKTISAKNDNYIINSNKELFALGLSKVVGSFFLAFPATASFARSAINDDLKAKSGISSIVRTNTFIFYLMVLLFTKGGIRSDCNCSSN
jgi:SulP family sulfate permease